MPLALICSLFFLTPFNGQDPIDNLRAAEWYGHQQSCFSFEGREGHLVIPSHPAPSRPWIWRARFPGYHTEADRMLVDRGFHIAYLNTGGMLGSERAMGYWDRFYETMLAQFDLSPRPALEGVSRGGLFIYRWASRHPERVSCIYADTPVCDIRSWPLGEGLGLGHDATWQGLLNEFGLTAEETLRYEYNPIDLLEPIAKAGISLLTVVSRSDVIVPPSENTDILAERYRALGGDIQIITVKEGTVQSNGHHFTHPDPLRVADFIERHSSGTPQAEGYAVLRGGLANCRIRFEREQKGRVVFLGGSITSNAAWQKEICAYLQSRFPKTEFDFIDAGVPSMGSTPGAFRFQSEALGRGRVDLLFQEAAVNDSTNGRSPQEMIRGVEGILRQARLHNRSMDCVLMHFVDPGKMGEYRRGVTPIVIQQHEKVAQHYGIATLGLALEVTERIDAGQFSWKDDFKNLHPAPFGHRLYGASIRRMLSNAWSGPLDAEAEIVEYSLPEALDAGSYGKGVLLPLSTASDLRGFGLREKCDPRVDGVGGGVRAGFVSVPMLVATEPGAELALVFEGRAVGLWVAAGPDAGVIEHRIDGGEWRVLDLFTRWSRALHLPWVYVLAGDLEAGQHRLEVRVTDQSNGKSRGHACRIVRLVVNGNQ